MKVRQILPIVVGCAIPALSVAAQISVGPNIQVSTRHEKDAHYESYAGASPTDPSRLLACSVLFLPSRPQQTSVVYLSKDGGRSWGISLQPDDVARTGDPICVFGPDGSAYYVALATYEGSAKEMIVYKSRDGGDTWGPPVHLPLVDREYIAFDGTGGKYNGRIYINGTGTIPGIDRGNINGVWLFRSLDAGATYQAPVVRQEAEHENITGMGNDVVLSDGTVLALFGHNKNTSTVEGRENRPNAANSWLRVVASADGGATISTGTVVSDWYMDRARSEGAHIPVLAVDPGSAAFKDRVYAAWVDAGSGRLAVLLSYSSDKGKSWSKPVVVDDGRTALNPADGPDAITPAIAVNKDGVVGIAWADRRGHADNLSYDKRFTASLDGGETFLPSVKVSTAPTEFGKDEMWPVTATTGGRGASASSLNVHFGVNYFFTTEGHTSGLAVDGGGAFHPAWIDSRTGVPQLWTASVTVSGKAIRHGEAELAALDDITSRVSLELTELAFDRTKNILTANARLKNKSKATIRGPIKVRAIDLRSDLGVPTVVEPDNQHVGAGAVWDFTSLLKNQALAPNEQSGAKTLRFRLTDLRPMKQGGVLKLGLLDLNVVVLGTTDKETIESGR
jgi:hypothetical protein